MNARVCASRSVNNYIAIVEQRQYSSQLSLDRPQAILYLPAMKVCAVVLKEEFEVHWSAAVCHRFCIFFGNSARIVKAATSRRPPNSLCSASGFHHYFSTAARVTVIRRNGRYIQGC